MVEPDIMTHFRKLGTILRKSPKRFRLTTLILTQVLLGVLLVMSLLLVNARVALSCLAGVSLIALANIILLTWFFVKRGADQPTQMLMRLYSGEVIKIVILISGVIFFARTFDIKWWAFILGIVVMQISYCVIPYFMYKKGTVVI